VSKQLSAVSYQLSAIGVLRRAPLIHRGDVVGSYDGFTPLACITIITNNLRQKDLAAAGQIELKSLPFAWITLRLK